MANTKDIVPVLQKEASELVKQVQAFTIGSPKDMESAADKLSIINKRLDTIEAEREKITKPLNQALKVERARWKPIETELETARDILRATMSGYQTEQKRLADIELANIAGRVGEGKGKLKPETAVRKMAEVDAPAQNVAANNGSVGFVTVKHFEVTDILALANATADSYVLPNEPAIRHAMRDGIELPGVRYWETQEARNTR